MVNLRGEEEGRQGHQMVLQLTRCGLQPIGIAWEPPDTSMPRLHPKVCKLDSGSQTQVQCENFPDDPNKEP